MENFKTLKTDEYGEEFILECKICGCVFKADPLSQENLVMDEEGRLWTKCPKCGNTEL